MFATHSNLRCRRSSDCRGCSRTYTMFRESTTKITRASLRSSSAGYLGSKASFRFHLNLYIYIYVAHGVVAILYSSQGQIYLILLNFIYMIFRFISKMDLYRINAIDRLSVREICWLAPRTHWLNTLPLTLI